MTQQRVARREFDALSRLFLVVFCLFLQPCAALAEASWHPVDDIGGTAERHLAQKIGSAGDKTTVRAGMLDERVRLARCDAKLEAFLRPGTKVGPKTIVGVRCPGTKPWKMYVPVEVVVRSKVWVARRALARGHLLAETDLLAEERDVSRMNTGYVTNLNSLLGQRLKTSILAGRAITEQIVQADDVVNRGQTVTLAVSSGGISIRMSGRALSDGALHERIRVENLNSGRVVEGIVRSSEIVEILVAETGINFNQNPKVRAN